ncbi:MAG TPA: hypothetical protein VFU04_03465 [Solirubrobacterales bacterium]|nr:hypothetical protein [Solirubrobacterales bacterium]
MPKEIFDQDRPRSTMAKRLDEAFAGCDQWTLAPPSPRRSTLDVAPWLGAPPSLADPTDYGYDEQERRAA